MTFTIILMLVGFLYAKCNSVSIRYVSIGETVILPCHDRSNSKTTSWRRRNEYLFRGYVVNQNIYENKRYAIVSNELNKDYNLKISNVTEKDYGTYICESQKGSGLTRTEYLLTVRDVTVNAKQGNHPSTSADNEHSTESSYWKQDIIISTILPEVEDSTYSLYYDRKSTEQNKDDSGIHGKTETELSSRELFLFGLFAAGLVLVLCVSVICNACINRKCKTGISQRNKRTAISNVDLKLENSDIIESDEITSLYEKINEDEMLPQSAIALRNNVRIAFHNPRPKPLVDLPENPYFEITEYYLEPVHQSDSDKAKQTLTIPNALLTAEHIQNSSHCFETNEDKTTTALQDSSDFESFTDECFSDKKPTDDGYLKPYVALNTNEMDYLHSYSTPILHQTLNTTACLDSSVQIVITDDYVDAFSPKQ